MPNFVVHYELRIKIIPNFEFIISNSSKYLYPLHIHILCARH